MNLINLLVLLLVLVAGILPCCGVMGLIMA